MSSSASLNASLESITDHKLHPQLQSNEILLTPIVSLLPHGVTFSHDQPAIIELTKSIIPTDQNPNRQLVPVYSLNDPLQWKELASHDCEMLNDRIRFKTTRFSYVSVLARFPFPSACVTVDPKIQQQAEITIQEIPGFKLEISPASVHSKTEISATILYDNPQVTDLEQFKDHSLASACVKLEPHNAQFSDKVKITLLIPNYNEILSKYPNVKLELWHSKCSDSGVPILWEMPAFTIHFSEDGNCLATASITHFCDITAWWSGLLHGCLNFFATHIRGRCQVFMSSEKRWGSFLTFGVAIILYPFHEPYQTVPNHPYLLFDSVVPIDVVAGDVECQINLNDTILSKFSDNHSPKSYRECRGMSRDYSMRVDFNIELATETASSKLPSGPLATLLIKHGFEEVKPHKFNLIKVASYILLQDE